MSDLKYIMDTTDDEDRGNDKYSRRPGASDLACSSNPSSTTRQSEDNSPTSTTPTSSTSQPRRRGLLSRPAKSATTLSPTTPTTANTDKASSSRPSSTEKRSVDSTESMDPASYRSYNQSSSSSAMPPTSRSSVSSRPMPNTTGERDIPVKLTPITGRVSRAKKGVPVHTCDTCKPPKTFTRAEHLRRHQLSHKPASFQCNWQGCDKVFHRQDLLTRHIQRHEQDEYRSGTDMTTSRGPSITPVESSVPVDRFQQPPMLPGNGMQMNDDMAANACYPGSASPYPPSSRGSVSGPGPMSPSSQSTRSHSTGFSHPQGEYILSSNPAPFGIPPSSMDGSPFHTNSYGLEFQPRRSPSYTYTGLEGLPSLTIPDSSFPGHLGQDSNWGSSASDSPYSTPDRMRTYDSPSADIPGADMIVYPHQYPSPHQPVYHTVSDYNTSYDDTSYFEFQPQQYPVRSPTPSTVTLSAQPVQNLVTLGQPVPDPSAVLTRQKGSAAVLTPYADATFLTGLVPSTAALNAIPRYLDVYWKRFDTLFPLVHRRSLETSVDPVLRCAMAAVGCQFLQSKEARINGHILHGFASQEARCRPQWTVQVMQAILLCEFYGRFRGSRAAARASEPFQSLYSRVATSETSVNHDNSASISHRHWDEWITAESRRRLLAASFVLDTHTSMYHEHSFCYPFTTPTPPIPLIKNTQNLWTAEDPETWEELLSAEPTQLSSVSVADEEITAHHVTTALPLDLAVYLASEAIRLPRRSPPSTLDFSTSLDLDSTIRIRSLFPDSPVAATYLALHYTPLRDLLAATGDSWLFSRKLLDQEEFQRRKLIVRSWSGSVHAGAASTFAAKALLAFLDDTDEDSSNGQSPTSQMSEISDYWAMYVCALICWSINRATRARDASAYNSNATSGKTEGDAREWLKTVASLDPETAHRNVRARREALGVVTLVRKRLEHESIGGKSKLLVDAVRVLKSLEDDPNRARF